MVPEDEIQKADIEAFLNGCCTPEMRQQLKEILDGERQMMDAAHLEKLGEMAERLMPDETE